MKSPEDDRAGAEQSPPEPTEAELKLAAYLRTRRGKRAVKRERATRARKAARANARAYRLATHAAWNDEEHREERETIAVGLVRDLRAAGLDERTAKRTAKRALAGVRA